jgi:hypothetical protein
MSDKRKPTVKWRVRWNWHESRTREDRELKRNVHAHVHGNDCGDVKDCDPDSEAENPK